ncbi:PH domain-containing [Cryptosporidium sp. chipmunk genotype I]|uniref:PH domain-containing n=1 Tax=Cryptosporidium sp. chipmunk genotype I TaxID=1280935 RepID=UPI00351AABFF|nr:PH domain-containing [Cryptosporidium sp. chipmunk genotype I]
MISSSVSTSLNSYENFDENEELKLTDEKKIETDHFQNEISTRNIINNFPVITGYYGVVLRKKKHPLFGSYWNKEYCLLQSNIFLCHELKYPYKIKRSISIASISKCEISKMDPCVYCLTINNNQENSEKAGISQVRGFSCFNFKNRKIEIIKIKCTSTLDTQKWNLYVNNTMKNWRSNKNNAKNLYNGNQYIEKTIAQELFEKMNKKLKKITIQSSINNMILIFRQIEKRNLYNSLYKIKINSIINSYNDIDKEIISPRNTSRSSISNNDFTFKKDLLLIKRRIILFKIEQGSNSLKRLIIKRMSEYWKLLKVNSLNNHGDYEFMELNYKLIIKRRIFLFWRELLKIVLLKNKNYKENRKSINSIVSKDSITTHSNNNNNFFHSNLSPELTSNENIQINTKKNYYKSNETKNQFKHNKITKETDNKNQTKFKILLKRDNVHMKNIDNIRENIVQITKLNFIILTKVKKAWNILEANRITNNAALFTHKYNQVQSFFEILERNLKLNLYRVFILLKQEK